MKWIVVRRRMKLQEHRIPTADDVGYSISSAQSDQHLIRGGAAVVHRQVILHYIALIPNSDGQKKKDGCSRVG